jgi:peptide deformylase
MFMKIVQYPNPILRQRCEKIKNPTDPVIQQLVLDMIKTMRANDGTGLAAPQIGKNIQLCIIEVDNEVFTLINPEIKNLSGKDLFIEEGCLSFPGKFLPVKRYEKIKVKAYDSNGKKQIIRARGLLSRAFQHEIDHLNGELFVDKAVEYK